MNRCPKCSSCNISHPQYRQTIIGEWLEYRCLYCGYIAKADCHDKNDQEQILTKFNQILANKEAE